MAEHMVSDAHGVLAEAVDEPVLTTFTQHVWRRVALPATGHHLFVSLCVEVVERSESWKGIRIAFRRWSEPGGCAGHAPVVDVVLQGTDSHRATARVAGRRINGELAFSHDDVAILWLPSVSAPQTLAIMPVA
jgi:hypothetical protein